LWKDLFNAKFILSSKRLQWIDYARGICIILVCYRHCFEGLKQAKLNIHEYPFLEILNICFYSFRMPLFFIISGMFISASLAKKGISNYLNNRFKIIFYPLLIWGAIQITMQLLMKDYVNARREPIDYLNLIIRPRLIEQFWYLNALFFVGTLYALLKYYLRVKLWQHIVLSIILYSIASYALYYEINIYLFADIFHYYIYFCIGDVLSGFFLKKNREETLTSIRWMIPSAILFIASQYLYTLLNIRHTNPAVNYYTDAYVSDKMPAFSFIVSLCGCAFIIQVAYLLQRTGVMKWLRVVGYHSLYIYLVHVMIIATVRIVILRVLHIDSIPVIIVPAMIAGITLPMILYNLAVRAGAWRLFSLKKPVDEMKFYAPPAAATT
jgi:fucose 4-O-acetylase-like acetyltransferase